MSAKRILIVDDDPNIGRLLSEIAEGAGFATCSINDPSMFESSYEEFSPDIVTLDLQMQAFDGVELLRKLGNRKAAVPIVLISGMDQRSIDASERLGTSFGLNIIGTLHKPFDIDDVETLLSKALAIAEPRRPWQPVAVTEADLANAIDSDQLVVFYQPKIDLKTSEIVGVEALVRWQHPEHKLVPPDAFIPLAEKTGLIKPLTWKVLEMALEDARSWREKLPDLVLSVNLSTGTFDDLELPDRIEEMARQAGHAAEQLKLEVTESGAMENPERSMDILVRLRIKNFQLSIDDFGTGYSSMIQLYRLPFNELKVDKSFVMDARTSSEAAAITRSTVNLGHSLGLTVVAEGVEDQKTFDWLADIGCDEGQGYFMSRPLPNAEFLAWIDDWKRKNG